MAGVDLIWLHDLDTYRDRAENAQMEARVRVFAMVYAHQERMNAAGYDVMGKKLK